MLLDQISRLSRETQRPRGVLRPLQWVAGLLTVFGLVWNALVPRGSGLSLAFCSFVACLVLGALNWRR